MASIVVFLVALPLCMGIAIASGAPASAGLIAGVIGGLIVGACAGCPLQVSGPAAGLSTVMFDAIQRHGLDQLGLIVMVAGIIQLVGGWFKIGQWFRAVSPAVIHGMLGGIGVLIFASQFHVMLDDVPQGSGLRDLIRIPDAIQKGARMPDLAQISSRDIRHDQRALLQDLGELHRRQINLNEQVASRIPHHWNRPEEQITVHLENYIKEQEDIRSTLGLTIERARNLYAEQKEKLRKIQVAGQEALDAQALSLGDLEKEKWNLIIPSQTETANRLADFQKVFKNHDLAAWVGVLSILVLLTWAKVARGPIKVIPAPLAAVTIATVLAAWWQLPILYVEVPQSMWEEVHLLRLSSLADVEWGGILLTGATIAVLASAQTLLTATAVDHMHHGERTDYDKELFAQGIGNSLCGLVGALPLAAVIVRSTANIEAGGKTRLSTMFHGLWMLLIVAFLGGWLRMIPTSALAAILVYTGYKLLDLKAIRKFWEFGAGEVLVYAVTLVTVVAVDLLVGVVTGFVASLVLLAYRFSRLRVKLAGPSSEGRYALHLDGAATFLKLPRLAAVLKKVPEKSIVDINVSRLHYIDQACLGSLQSWASQHEANGGDVIANWGLLEAWAQQGRGTQLAEKAVAGAKMIEREVIEPTT